MEKEKRLLQVGDVVQESTRYGTGIAYIRQFEILRVTSVRAYSHNDNAFNRIIANDNGVRAYPIPRGWHTPDYHLLTPELQEKVNAYKYRRKVEQWFDTYKFAFEQKEELYNQINKP